MWKKILLVFVFVFGFGGVYWLEITLSTDKNNLDINETVSLNLNVKQTEESQNQWWQIGIAWLESFEQIAQTQSSNYVNINWKLSFEQNISLHLKAKKSWEFVIWPATVIFSGQKIDSNTVSISVTWTQLFVGNASPDMVQMTKNQVRKNTEIPVLSWDSELTEKTNWNKLWFTFFLSILAVMLSSVFLFRSKKNIKQQPSKEKVIFTIPSEEQKNFWDRCFLLTHLALQSLLWFTTQSMTFEEIQKNNDFQKLDSEIKKIFLEIFGFLKKQKYSTSKTNKSWIIFYLKELKKHLNSE